MSAFVYRLALVGDFKVELFLYSGVLSDYDKAVSNIRETLYIRMPINVISVLRLAFLKGLGQVIW